VSDLWIGPRWRRDKETPPPASDACKGSVRDAKDACRAACASVSLPDALATIYCGSQTRPAQLGVSGPPGSTEFLHPHDGFFGWPEAPDLAL